MIEHPFKRLTRAQAAAMLLLPEDDAEKIALNRKLYDGDHWMDGEGWIGPISATSDKSVPEIKEELRKRFASRNVVKEVVDRKVDGLLKQNPKLSFCRKGEVTDEKPLTPEEEVLIEEATGLRDNWWKKRKLLKLLKEVEGRAQLGERVVVRIYVPMGLLEKDAQGRSLFPTGSIEDCLNRIHVRVAEPGTAGIETDEATQLQGGVYDTRMVGGIHGAETLPGISGVQASKRFTEIVYLDNSTGTEANADTVIRTITDPEPGAIDFSPENLPGNQNQSQNGEGGGEIEGTEWRLKLGGRLTMFEPGLRGVISQQVRENQAAINLAKTMQNQNIVIAGFTERVILDAMPPGKWIQNPDNTEEEVYEVGPFKVGGGTTNFYMAAEYRNPNTGETRYGNPSIQWKEPSPTSVFTEAKRDCYQDILEEVGQPHILISGDATASGKSREQAREIFRSTLEDDEGELNPLVEWLAETSLAMAALFAGQPGRFDSLVAEAQCYLNTGPLSGTERQDNREDVKAGQLSVKSAMMRSGVESPADELEQIRKEQEESLEAVEQKATILQTLTASGSGIKGASKVARFSDEDVTELGRTDFVPPSPVNPVAQPPAPPGG